MDKVSVLTIRDKDEDQEALAIVRSVNGLVALTLSLEHEGDVQMTFTPSECQELVRRLQQAISDAQGEALISGSSAGAAPVPNPSREIELDRGEKIKNG
jgi:hypothetical protein